MTIQEAALLVVLILAIAYTGLHLYFTHRQEKQLKEWREKLKRTQSLKKN